MAPRTTPFKLASFSALAMLWCTTVAVVPALPGQLAIHWNIHGQADGFMPRWPGALAIPVCATFFNLLFLAMPRFHARLRTGGDAEMLAETQLWMTLFHGIMQALILGAALGSSIPISTGIPLAMGFLFFALGFSFGRQRHCGPVTYNLPWPVTTEEGRLRMQRAVSTCMKASGAAILCGALLPPVAGFVLILLAVGGMVAALFISNHRIARAEAAR